MYSKRSQSSKPHTIKKPFFILSVDQWCHEISSCSFSQILQYITYCLKNYASVFHSYSSNSKVVEFGNIPAIHFTQPVFNFNFMYNKNRRKKCRKKQSFLFYACKKIYFCCKRIEVGILF